jgi:hypothetical protein
MHLSTHIDIRLALPNEDDAPQEGMKLLRQAMDFMAPATMRRLQCRLLVCDWGKYARASDIVYYDRVMRAHIGFYGRRALRWSICMGRFAFGSRNVAFRRRE